MPVRSAYVVGGAAGRSAPPTSARSCAAAVTVWCPICPQKDVNESGRVSDGEPGDLQILVDRGPTYRLEFMPDWIDQSLDEVVCALVLVFQSWLASNSTTQGCAQTAVSW